MLLATILLLYPFPQSGDALKAVTERPRGVSVYAAKDSSSSRALPSVPDPKIKTDAEIAADSNAAGVTPGPAAQPIAPGSAPLAIRPAKPLKKLPAKVVIGERSAKLDNGDGSISNG